MFLLAGLDIWEKAASAEPRGSALGPTPPLPDTQLMGSCLLIRMMEGHQGHPQPPERFSLSLDLNPGMQENPSDCQPQSLVPCPPSSIPQMSQGEGGEVCHPTPDSRGFLLKAVWRFSRCAFSWQLFLKGRVILQSQQIKSSDPGERGSDSIPSPGKSLLKVDPRR